MIRHHGNPCTFFKLRVIKSFNRLTMLQIQCIGQLMLILVVVAMAITIIKLTWCALPQKVRNVCIIYHLKFCYYVYDELTRSFY